jgi:hypothetical protein
MLAIHQGESVQGRLKPLVRWRILLAAVLAIASPAASIAAGTPEAREACTPDVFRLCSAQIPDADEITACLRKKNTELSAVCRRFVMAGIKSSGKTDSIAARKRAK